MTGPATARTVYLETFGCQMNELDSELVAGQLRAMGYGFTNDPDTADVVLYNTCSVREHAEQKVWSRLGELKETKIERPNLVVGVLGCMAERDGVDLVNRMPVVDVLCGPGELDKLPGLLDNAVKTRASLLAEPPIPTQDGRPRIVSAREVALQGNASRRLATLAAAADSLEMLDLSRSMSPLDEGEGKKSDCCFVFQERSSECGYSACVFFWRMFSLDLAYLLLRLRRAAMVTRPAAARAREAGSGTSPRVGGASLMNAMLRMALGPLGRKVSTNWPAAV